MQGRVLAAAQTVPVAGDVIANITAHLVLAELAGKNSAKVLVFPELSLTGCEISCAAQLAFSVDDERLDELARLARQRATTLVVGAPLRDADRLHIARVWRMATFMPER